MLADEIEAFLKETRLSMPALARLAKVPDETVRNILRFGTEPTGSKYNRLKNVLLTYSSNQIDGETPLRMERVGDVHAESDIAMAFMFKMVFSLLMKHGMVSARGLDINFTEARDHYQKHKLAHAAILIESLQKFVKAEPPGLEKEAIHRLLELVPLGSA